MCSDRDHDGEVDQPPRKIQKTDAGADARSDARPEAYRDSREPMDTCKPPVHEQSPLAAACKHIDLPRSTGAVQGAANEHKALPVSQASVVQPDSVHRAESNRESAGEGQHQQQTGADTAADRPKHKQGCLQ